MKQKGNRSFWPFVVAIVLMAVILGCDPEVGLGNGSLEIRLDGTERSVNWLPGIDMGINSYTITGIGPNLGDSFMEQGFHGGTYRREELAVGSWSITIDGYNQDGKRVGTGTVEATVRKNLTTQAIAQIQALPGSGFLNVSVSWADSQDKMVDPQVYIQIMDGQGNGLSAFQDPIRLTLGEDGKSATGMIADIPAGWYESSILLYEGSPAQDGDSVWQDVHAFRIVKDETTEGVVVIPDEEIQFGTGSVSINIEEKMESPFEVSFIGLPESVKEEEEVTVVAAGTFGDDAAYRWYVNGVRQTGTTNEFKFSSSSAGHYRINLLVSSGEVVCGHLQSVEVLRAIDEVAADIAALEIGYAQGEHAGIVMSGVMLPTTGAHGTKIIWESSDDAFIDTRGTVTRPAFSVGDVKVELTATIERGTVRETKTFTMTVIKLPQSDAEAVAADKASLEIGFNGLDHAEAVTQDVELAVVGDSGTTITWDSSAPETVTTTGTVARPDYTVQADVQVSLTATITKGVTSQTKSFTLTVKVILQEQTVTFESNGGSTIESKVVYWGRLIQEPQAPSKVGFSFEGWYADEALSDPWDFSQDYVGGDQILYAKWGSGYLITFDGFGASLTFLTTNVGFGMPYGIFPTTLKAGHSLQGWYTKPYGDGERVSEETLLSINSNHTLYAYWLPNTYTVTFDAQGGDTAFPSTKTVTFGQAYGELASVSKAGYTFDGWWTGEGGTGNQITSTTLVFSTADRTLYAKWVFTVFTGQAGGLVFYENPNYELDGWRYLEAAPADWYDWAIDPLGSGTGLGDPWCQWGAYGYLVESGIDGNQAIGTGEINTENIVNYHETLWLRHPEKGDYYSNPTDYHEYNNGTVAAKVCAEYSVEYLGLVYEDWFLPSRDELNELYINLKLQNLGGLADGAYWSSSNSDIYGYVIDLFNGSWGYGPKYNGYHFRPIRAY